MVALPVSSTMSEVWSVMNIPGEMELTRTPRAAQPAASDRVMAITPPLLAAYAADDGPPS